ncbi:MAG: hypothetical protein JWQ34_957 [Mucilaginibacter sp.]|jgi:hypothetical protein|uniref:hypothetical protein n=1 Tax=Mucilaginibacter sp. TaxID=1882438 RepID=UPI00263925CC|nr:hypothetical protein [Mucilaginibacter sp.]MDB5002732.1 hypothetical protein [Mucilaginibacter sp.]
MANDLPNNKTDQYLKEKAANKKKGNKALVVFLFLIFIVISVVVKITLTGSLKPDFFKGLPGSDDAYTIAKEFIRPTLKSSSANFSDTKYQFGKQSDSVYVIQSSVESRNDSGDKINTEFKIVLKYNGGQVDKQKNWTLIDLSQN